MCSCVECTLWNMPEQMSFTKFALDLLEQNKLLTPMYSPYKAKLNIMQCTVYTYVDNGYTGKGIVMYCVY